MAKAKGLSKGVKDGAALYGYNAVQEFLNIYGKKVAFGFLTKSEANQIKKYMMQGVVTALYEHTAD